MAKKMAMNKTAGGFLMLIGTLLYLYIAFSWYNSNATAGPWLSSAQFFGPFVAAFTFIGAITLFFMSIGTMTGRRPENEYMSRVMWSFMTLTGLAFLIVTGGSAWFYWAVLAFVIAFIGGIIKMT